MSVFGQIVDGSDVQDAVKGTIELWIATYIAEVERQKSLEPASVDLPRSYVTVDDGTLNKWPEHQIPAVLVMTPGTSRDPRETADGITATYAVNIAVVVSQMDQESTRAMAQYYCGAIGALMMQNQSLGGFANGIKWNGSRWDDLPPDDGRTMAAAVNVFEVDVERVIELGSHGLTEPPADPYAVPDFETPLSVSVEVEQETP